MSCKIWIILDIKIEKISFSSHLLILARTYINVILLGKLGENLSFGTVRIDDLSSILHWTVLWWNHKLQDEIDEQSQLGNLKRNIVNICVFVFFFFTDPCFGIERTSTVARLRKTVCKISVYHSQGRIQDFFRRVE